jgi:hypothetical protein
MNKSLLLAVAFVALISTTATGQITILADDFPEVGNLVISAIDRTTTIDPGTPGTNKTWNFANLVASEWDSVYYLAPSAVPASQNYPEATMVASHNPGPPNTDYHYNFIHPTSGGWKSVGDQNYTILFPGFSLAMYVKYIPSSYYLPVPFTYGNSHNQSFKMEWYMTTTMSGTVLDSIQQISHVDMSMLADASGTMVNPFGSFPAIRVKEILVSNDSVFDWTGTGWVYTSDTTNTWTQYRWYTNNYGEIGYYKVGSKKADGFTFFSSETLVGLSSLNAAPALAVYPNPTESKINLKERSSEQVEIFDLNGKAMQVQGNNGTFDVSAFPAGTYVVKVKTHLGYATGRFVKQ